MDEGNTPSRPGKRPPEPQSATGSGLALGLIGAGLLLLAVSVLAWLLDAWPE